MHIPRTHIGLGVFVTWQTQRPAQQEQQCKKPIMHYIILYVRHEFRSRANT